MATKFAITVSVKAMETQRWICRIQWFQFMGSSQDGLAKLAAEKPRRVSFSKIKIPGLESASGGDPM
jgi:hypothetical protein